MKHPTFPARILCDSFIRISNMLSFVSGMWSNFQSQYVSFNMLSSSICFLQYVFFFNMFPFSICFLQHVFNMFSSSICFLQYVFNMCPSIYFLQYVSFFNLFPSSICVLQYVFNMFPSIYFLQYVSFNMFSTTQCQILTILCFDW